MLESAASKGVDEQGGVGCIVWGKSRPECPKGNLRELK